MNELPPDAKALLALAKASHEPSDPFVKERVRQQVQIAVAAGALLSASSAKAITATATKSGLLSSLVGKVSVAAVALSMAGGGALLYSQHAEPRANRHVQIDETARHQPVAPAAHLEQTIEPLAPVAEQTASAEEPRVTQRAANHPGRGAPSLSEELKLLRAASEALARGDVTQGGALLREHRQRFAQPVLREERDGLELVARCQRGEASAPAQAKKFLGDHGGAMLAATIRQACALEKAH